MKLLEHVHLLASGKAGLDWTHASDCNVYLLDGGEACALIDSGAGASTREIVKHVGQAGIDPSRVTHLFLTHAHADHAGGAGALRAALGVKVAAHWQAEKTLREGDEKAIDLDRARKAGFYPRAYRFRPCPVDLRLRDGAVFEIGRLRIRVVTAPGHSRFDTYYYVDAPDGHVALFTGDGLMYGGKISMIYSRDFNLHALADALMRLRGEKADSLFPGHLQPALRHGHDHIEAACACLDKMQAPPNML